MQAGMLNVLTREDWGGRDLEQRPPQARTPVDYVFCMSTHTEQCRDIHECGELVRRMEHVHTHVHHHVAIRYNFLIAGDGSVYEGRGWGVQGMLPLRFTRYNDRSLVIGFIGEYLEETLPEEMKIKREQLVKYGIQEKLIAGNFEAIQLFEREIPVKKSMKSLFQ